MQPIDPSYVRRQIGRKLQVTREAQGKSITDITVETGIRPGKLAALEAGEVNFRILTLEKLCRAYGLTIPQLLLDLTLEWPA